MPMRAMPDPRSPLAVLSWALYDLANTVFSMNIVSLYFSLWVVLEMGGRDADYGYANALSMLLIFLTAPALGAFSDQVGRRMPFLVVTTLACVLFTALLGLGDLRTSLVFFVIANYMFQAGLIFYDSLLAVVSTPENRGRIGGLGIGVGYLGSFLGVGSGLLFLDRIGYVGMFRLSAVLFLLFALPCFLFVREPHRSRGSFDLASVAAAFRQIAHTIPHARTYPSLLRFLLARFLYTDPANTVIVFMSIYVTGELGLTRRQAELLLLVAISAAVAGSLGWGFVVDRFGPRRTLSVVLGLWMTALALAILLATTELPARLIWLVGCLAGIALGGTWTADRPLMLRLSPPRFLGEFYGLYSMVGRFAAIVGPFMWGLVVDQLGWPRPVAIAVLLAFMLLALLVLQGVDDRRRQWPAELQA